MIFGKITDFHAYDNLCYYSIKWKCACSVSKDDTIRMQLEHGNKNVLLKHHSSWMTNIIIINENIIIVIKLR